MIRRLPWLLGAVETYLLLLIAWYVILLTAGIPSISSIALAFAAIALFALVAGAGWATAHLDRGALMGTILRVAALFLLGSVAFLLVGGTTDLTFTQFVKTSLVGRVLFSLVGAALLVGVTMAVVAAVKTLWRRRPAR